MSSFIEDGVSDISAFASIPVSGPFRRLPTNTHTFIGFSMVISIAVIGVTGLVRSCLRGRWRFDCPREVRLALFQERRKRLLRVFRADLRTKLFVLTLHPPLDLPTKWLLHEPLAGLQRCGRLRCQ